MNTKIISAFLILLLVCSNEAFWGWGWGGGWGGGWGRRRGYYGRRRGYRRGYGRGFRRGGGLIAAGLLGAGLLGLKLAFLGKKKRSVDDDFADVEEVSPFEEALNRFDLAMEFDEDLCTSKTLCELMTTKEPLKQPLKEIKAALDRIYSGELPIMGMPEHKEATELLEAGLIGNLAKRKNICDEVFKSCTADSDTRMEELADGYTYAQKYNNKP